MLFCGGHDEKEKYSDIYTVHRYCFSERHLADNPGVSGFPGKGSSDLADISRFRSCFWPAGISCV